MRASKKKAARHGKQNRLTAVPLTVGSPELGKPTLTVGQIVEQLSPVAPDAAAMSERIRHWTREGLLFPVNQHHAGTGRHRRYSPHATYEAAILNALATAGLQLVSRPYIQPALSQARAALQKWQELKSAGHKLPLFFLVILHESGEPTASVREGIGKHDPNAEVMVVVNLSRLFLRVGTRAEYLDNDKNAEPKQHW